MSRTEAWKMLAHRGRVRDQVGKEGMGQVVRHGILKNLPFVLFRTIRAYSGGWQVFEHILLYNTPPHPPPQMCSRHSSFIFQGIFYSFVFSFIFFEYM